MFLVFVSLAAYVGILVYFIKIGNEAVREVDSWIDEILAFFNACESFYTEAKFTYLFSVEVNPDRTVCAYMDVAEAAKRPYSMPWELWDDAKFDAFINPSDAYELIDSMDMKKIRSRFGENVRIKPSKLDNESIVFYISKPLIPIKLINVQPYTYINILVRKLKPHLSIKKRGKTWARVDFQKK